MPTDDPPDRPPAFRQAEPLVLDDLLLAHMPALLVFLRHRTGGALAARETTDDLAQSVCREVLQHRDRLVFRSNDEFRAYLFLQAVHKVVDRARFHHMARRDSRRQQELPASRTAAEHGIYSSLVTGSRVASAKERLEFVEKCLQSLPEAQREAVLLSRVAGLSYEQIARQRGVAEVTIRGLVARGLARMWIALEQWGG